MIILKSRKQKKGQAAIEFLITYGWAILIVLVALSALAYFGIMNPSKYLSDKCIFGNNFNCVDYHINTTYTQLSIVNGLGQKVYNPVATLSDGGQACTLTNPNPVPQEWLSDSPVTVKCNTQSLGFIQKDKAKVKITISYQKVSGGFNHSSMGEVYALVQAQ